MAEVAKDYLGHPCKVTEAREYFEDQLEDARKESATHHLANARHIGSELLELSERVQHAHNSIRALLASLPYDDECDPVRALLVMAERYNRQTSDLYFGFAGRVLLALEQEDARRERAPR